MGVARSLWQSKQSKELWIPTTLDSDESSPHMMPTLGNKIPSKYPRAPQTRSTTYCDWCICSVSRDFIGQKVDRFFGTQRSRALDFDDKEFIPTNRSKMSQVMPTLD